MPPYVDGARCAPYVAYYTLANGAKYNQTIGGLPYYIQQNWVNAISPTGANGYCAQSY